MENQYGNQPQLISDGMEPIPPSVLAYPCADPQFPLFWDVVPIPEVQNAELPKYQDQPLELEPIYHDQILNTSRHDFTDLEFLTPNQPGPGAPNKAVSLPEMNLPPPIMRHQYSTPTTTPCAAIPHTPVTPPTFAGPSAVPPALNGLPAARCSSMSGSSSATGSGRKPAVRSRSPSDPRNISPKEIPTQVGEFEISPGLKCDLAGGPVHRGRRAKTRHTESETDTLIERLYEEADRHAELRKMEVRDYLKGELDAMKKDMDSRKRGLFRSRREAKVSRVKTDEFSKALKGIIRYMIMNTDTRRPDPCDCHKLCGKRKAPPS